MQLSLPSVPDPKEDKRPALERSHSDSGIQIMVTPPAERRRFQSLSGTKSAKLSLEVTDFSTPSPADSLPEQSRRKAMEDKFFEPLSMTSNRTACPSQDFSKQTVHVREQGFLAEPYLVIQEKRTGIPEQQLPLSPLSLPPSRSRDSISSGGSSDSEDSDRRLPAQTLSALLQESNTNTSPRSSIRSVSPTSSPSRSPPPPLLRVPGSSDELTETEKLVRKLQRNSVSPPMSPELRRTVRQVMSNPPSPVSSPVQLLSSKVPALGVHTDSDVPMFLDYLRTALVVVSIVTIPLSSTAFQIVHLAAVLLEVGQVPINQTLELSDSDEVNFLFEQLPARFTLPAVLLYLTSCNPILATPCMLLLVLNISSHWYVTVSRFYEGKIRPRIAQAPHAIALAEHITIRAAEHLLAVRVLQFLANVFLVVLVAHAHGTMREDWASLVGHLVTLISFVGSQVLLLAQVITATDRLDRVDVTRLKKRKSI